MWTSYREFFYFKHDLSEFLGSPLIFLHTGSSYIVFDDHLNHHAIAAWEILKDEFPSIEYTEMRHPLVISDVDAVKLKLKYF